MSHECPTDVWLVMGGSQRTQAQRTFGCAVITSREQEVLKLVRELGIVRGKDLEERGFSRRYLSRLVGKGGLERISRGLYGIPDSDVTEHQSFAEIAKLYPDVVVCLLSALQFHGLTTQMPRQVWIAIDVDGRVPAKSPVRVRIVRFSGRALTEGIEIHNVGSVPIQVYSVAKTVADCFKFRNKIGTDVAVEALRESLRDRRTSPDELLKFGAVCRVDKVMRPYLEAVV
jgi:predicted transcriptional regulator of viral defense system